MKESTTKQSDSKSVLCYLTDDWQTRISDGPKNSGQVIRYKYGITATNYCWALTEFRDGSIPAVRVNASNFAHLAPSFKTEAGLSAFDSMRRCQQALEAIAKIMPNLKPIPGGLDVDTAIDYAVQVDTAYETNFALHNNVKKRYFGESEDDTEE
jgi:hypothetical protein